MARDLPVGIKHKDNKFAAFTSYLDKRNYLGVFDSIEEAVLARETSLKELVKDTQDCVLCGKNFEIKSKKQRFCSPKCKGQYKYCTDRVTTQSQYENISGN